jgi:hypothetical protein
MSAAENKAVFLSYASQDARASRAHEMAGRPEAARRISEALRAVGPDDRGAAAKAFSVPAGGGRPA